ncbi:unnamed protein product [Parnassius apollo]|uniref:(apollo) hypothetical protein n=1 Tax=Parnassius apollo TaxID=110799 RepID=A0A8S3WQP3_PARAO|nr:unnamed protein product [Parnassius apollo]
MQFLVDALKSRGFLQEKQSLNDITSDFVCDFQSKECMLGECHICAERKLFGCDDQEEIEVTWFEWAMKEHAYGQDDKMKQIKRMMKTTKEGTLKDLLNKFNTEMTKFKKQMTYLYVIFI